MASKATSKRGTLAAADAKRLSAAFAKAGSKATPVGSKGGGTVRSFKVQGHPRTYNGMADLAARDPDLFATLDRAKVQPLGKDGKPLAGKAKSGSVGALMAWRTNYYLANVGK